MREQLSWPAAQPELDDGQILLRPWRPEDADAVHAACQDALIQRYTAVPVPYFLEHAVDFVEVVEPAGYAAKTGAGVAVTHRGTRAILGACGLVTIDLTSRTGYAGYWITPSSRQRHVASRAVRLLTDWALSQLGLAAIRLEIEPENLASVGVAGLAGFVPVPGPALQQSHRGQLREFAVFERTGRG